MRLSSCVQGDVRVGDAVLFGMGVRRFGLRAAFLFRMRR